MEIYFRAVIWSNWNGLVASVWIALKAINMTNTVMYDLLSILKIDATLVAAGF